MRNPFHVVRLGAFVISLLLLLEAIEPGYGIHASWGWYMGLFFLTLLTVWDLLSFIACILAFALLVGIFDASKAMFIVETIFTSIALLRPHGPKAAAKLGYRAWAWRGGRGWDGDRTIYRP